MHFKTKHMPNISHDSRYFDSPDGFVMDSAVMTSVNVALGFAVADVTDELNCSHEFDSLVTAAVNDDWLVVIGGMSVNGYVIGSVLWVL